MRSSLGGLVFVRGIPTTDPRSSHQFTLIGRLSRHRLPSSIGEERSIASNSVEYKSYDDRQSTVNTVLGTASAGEAATPAFLREREAFAVRRGRDHSFRENSG